MPFLYWQVKVIFEFLKNGFQEISSSLDLSFEDDSVADEKIPFLAYLASTLKNNSYFPYEPPAGSKRFRNLIAGFLKTYHHIPLTADVRNQCYINYLTTLQYAYSTRWCFIRLYPFSQLYCKYLLFVSHHVNAVVCRNQANFHALMNEQGSVCLYPIRLVQ